MINLEKRTRKSTTIFSSLIFTDGFRHANVTAFKDRFTVALFQERLSRLCWIWDPIISASSQFTSSPTIKPESNDLNFPEPISKGS